MTCTTTHTGTTTSAGAVGQRDSEESSHPLVDAYTYIYIEREGYARSQPGDCLFYKDRPRGEREA